MATSGQKFACCKQTEWFDFWNKHENTLKPGRNKLNVNNGSSSIGFDLWCIAHGLRDCLLIDHSFWRKVKSHKKILVLIKQLNKRIDCSKTLNHFYFDNQLFICNSIKFKLRLLDDIKYKFNQYLFINVSPKINRPHIIKDKQALDLVHSALMQIVPVLLKIVFNHPIDSYSNHLKIESKCNNNNVNTNDDNPVFIIKSKRKKRKKRRTLKQIGKVNENRISDEDINSINRYFYPTICGYLLNYLFIYYTDDLQLNCLSQHQLKLLRFKFQNRDIIQFSVPQILYSTIKQDILSKYCNKLTDNNLTISTEAFNQSVSL